MCRSLSVAIRFSLPFLETSRRVRWFITERHSRIYPIFGRQYKKRSEHWLFIKNDCCLNLIINYWCARAYITHIHMYTWHLYEIYYGRMTMRFPLFAMTSDKGLWLWLLYRKFPAKHVVSTCDCSSEKLHTLRLIFQRKYVLCFELLPFMSCSVLDGGGLWCNYNLFQSLKIFYVPLFLNLRNCKKILKVIINYMVYKRDNYHL